MTGLITAAALMAAIFGQAQDRNVADRRRISAWKDDGRIARDEAAIAAAKAKRARKAAKLRERGRH